MLILFVCPSYSQKFIFYYFVNMVALYVLYQAQWGGLGGKGGTVFLDPATFVGPFSCSQNVFAICLTAELITWIELTSVVSYFVTVFQQIWLFLEWMNVHCVSKNILDICDCNLKTNYQILIILGTNISDTTCHQLTVQFSTSPSICFCTTWGKPNRWNITFLSNAIWLLK